jgi:hypothetical protein
MAPSAVALGTTRAEAAAASESSQPAMRRKAARANENRSSAYICQSCRIEVGDELSSILVTEVRIVQANRTAMYGFLASRNPSLSLD